MQKTIVLTFLSDWHISSGQGDGFLTDAVLVRDADGFPFVAGRALRGALREGARRVGLCREDLRKTENYIFGTERPTLDSNISGVVRISAAQIAPQLKSQLFNCQNPDEFISDLTTLRKQTALTPEGVAKPSTLRSIECGIQGLELFSAIEIFDCALEPAWIEQYLACICAAVKTIGGNRSRGMGRCSMTVQGYNKKITLPDPHPYICSLGGNQ